MVIAIFYVYQILDFWTHQKLWNHYFELYQDFTEYRQDNINFLEKQNQALENILGVLDN